MTWPVAPDPEVIPEPESAEQKTLPVLSVVSFPPPVWVEQFWPDNLKAPVEETVKDAPMDTLPEVDKVAKEVCAATVKPDKPWIKELNTPVAPTPTFPTRLDMPVTFKVFKAAADETVKDWDIPTLPVTSKV